MTILRVEFSWGGISSIHFFVRAEVDEQQNFRAGFGMFLSGKDNPAVVSDGTGVQAGELPAEVMGHEAGIVEVVRHAPQGGFDLRLKRGIFPDQASKRPLKPGREDEFAHDSYGRAQADDDIVGGLALEFAGAKGFDRPPGFRRRVAPPRFDASLAQEVFQHFPLVGRQSLSRSQDAIQSLSGHRFRWFRFALCYYTRPTKASTWQVAGFSWGHFPFDGGSSRRAQAVSFSRGAGETNFTPRAMIHRGVENLPK